VSGTRFRNIWQKDILKNYNSKPTSIKELEKCLQTRKREGKRGIVLRVNLVKEILANFRENMVDYTLINESLESSINAFNSIVTQEKLKVTRKRL